LKPVWPVSGRDGYSLLWYNRLEDGSIILITWSYEDPNICAEVEGYVRMKVHLGALQFIPDANDTKTIVK
jgi:hypothetical protein